MKHSIRTKLSLIIVGMAAGIILFICAFNAFFLERYYMRMQQEDILQAFYKVLAVLEEEQIDKDELAEVLYDISNGQNMKVLITDSNFTPVYALKSDVEVTIKWLKDNIFSTSAPAGGNRVIAMEDNYVIQTGRNTYDNRENLELIGSDGAAMYNVIIQVPLESISKSVRICNHFILIVGVIAMFFGFIISYVVAKGFTEPIKKLSKTAEAVARMDFDVKYESDDKSELGLLGNSINKMSDNLQKYISDLKAANLELEKDIRRREELDDMRKDFVSNVSHELKTPIALIQGYAEGLKDGITDDPESMEFYCDVIVDEAAKMNNMVKQLLTLNQLEAGNEPLNIERFDIGGHIGEIVRTNAIRAQQKGAKIEFDCEEPVYVWADQFQIEQVITNYISNAINHVESKNGEPVIKIYCETAGDKVRVHVFNTGRNIPEEEKDKIWEKFYKVDKARTREYGGSGVGLSIVKAILGNHGQKYGVDNLEDGVDFWFELDKS